MRFATAAPMHKKEVTNFNMTDAEFATRLEIRLRKYLAMDDHHREKLWQIIADIRGIEREEISREKMFEQRKHIYPFVHR
jgi:hypothetical protein